MSQAAACAPALSLFPETEEGADETSLGCEHHWIGTGVEFLHGDREVLERWCPECGQSDYVFRREKPALRVLAASRNPGWS